MRRTVKKVAAPKGEADKVVELYEQYADSKEDGIGPEGVERLCCDLGLDPADRRVLLLAWKMGAQRMGFFTRTEFEQGFRSLRVNSLAAAKKALGLAAEELEDPDLFLDFLDFAFKFCLTEPRQKIIDVETAVQMLQLAFVENCHVAPFCAFLQAQAEYKTVNRDQWQGFARFSMEVACDCSNYDEGQAWPLLLDNYVDWRRENSMDS